MRCRVEGGGWVNWRRWRCREGIGEEPMRGVRVGFRDGMEGKGLTGVVVGRCGW